MAKKQAPADYSFGPGKSPTMGAINAGFATFNATAIAFESHVSPALGLEVGAMAVVASVGVLFIDNHTRFTEGRAMCYRAACWLGAGVWSFVQLQIHPWSWKSTAVLAGGIAAAAIVGGVLRRGERRALAAAEVKAQAAEARKAAQQAALDAARAAAIHTEEERIAAYWLPRFQKICRLPAMQIEGVEIWETGDGYTLGCLLPDDGTTIDRVKPYGRALATSADMLPGCNVEIVGNIDGESRRVFHARINTVNALALPQPYPDDYSDRSIVDDLELAVASDRSIGGVNVNDNNVAVVGQIGSGKSTMLNVATAAVARCTDALVLAIDTKGNGEYPRRWIRAHYQGRAQRPAIHLVAVTDEQAELLTLGLRNVVDGRPAAYHELSTQQNSMKLLPTPAVPKLILIVDEFKSMTAVVKANIEYIMDKGRSAGVHVIVCALEAKSAALPASIRAQCRERVGLRFNDESAIQYLFDATWKSGRFDPASMTHAGMMLIGNGAQPPLQHKGYDLDPARIDEIAIAVGEQRPALDQPSIDMFDTVTRMVRDAKGNRTTETLTGVYTTWWAKTLPLMFGTGGNDDGGREMANAGPVTTVTSAGSSGDDALEAMEASGSRLRETLERARAEAAAVEAARSARQPEADLDSDAQPAATSDPDFDAIVADFDLDSPARLAYYEILREVGEAGIGGTDMERRLQADGHRTRRQTIQDWFVEDFGYLRVLKLDGGKYRWNPDQP
jgi:hypothetical protein